MRASVPDAPINLILNQRMDQMDSFTESNYSVIRLRWVEAPTPRSNLLRRDWVSSARALTHTHYEITQIAFNHPPFHLFQFPPFLLRAAPFLLELLRPFGVVITVHMGTAAKPSE